MKKFFTLLLSFVAFSVVSANAQTWDFTKGLSDATKENLKVDATNWATNRTNADGVVTGWKNAVKFSGVATANGQAITELDGLTFLSMASGHLLLDPASIRWGGASEGVTIKSIKKGQTITVKAKSANSSAVNRSIVCNTEGVTYISGPADGICYGSAVTADQYPDVALAESGVYTLVWSVDTDNEDGIDVTIQTGSNGGIDIQSIKVSGGSAEEDKSVAWVSADFLNDMAYAMKPSTGINYSEVLSTADISVDSLRSFDAVVISPNVAADSPLAKLLADNISYVPMINLNDGLFGYVPASTANETLTAVDMTNELFTGVELTEDGQFTYGPVGYALPEKFSADDILAKNGDAVAIHQHNATRNSYIFIPTPENVDYAGAWNSLMINAISIVSATKRAITAVSKPSINETYAEGTTTATITCGTANSTIYYAIGNGEYQQYTEPLTFTDSLTVNAYAVAEGYNQSATSTKQITIKHVANEPSFSTDYTNPASPVVTITAEDGATIYYNFTGSDQTAQSTVYTEPIQLTENCTVTAFAAVDGKITSATASTNIIIDGYKPFKKTIAHFDANKAEWSNGQSKTYYYCSELDGSAKKYNLSENHTVKYAPEASEWTLYTSGQQVVWESTSPLTNVGDVSNYNPVRASDVIDCQITSGEITVGTTGSSEQVIKASDGVTDSTITVSDAPSFELVSNVKYQAPFDVLTYIGSKPGKVGFEYFVSADGENWTSIGTSAEGPTYTDAASKWRLWHRDNLKYEGTDAVYLKIKSISTDSYRIFDVFVNGEGEADAIQSVTADKVENTQIRKYACNGQIVIMTPRGTFNAAGQRIK